MLIINYKMRKAHEVKYSMSAVLIMIFICLCRCQYEVTRVQVGGVWQLHVNSCPNKQVTGLVVNTTVPTVLHLDLFKSGKIQDPFYGSNHLRLDWVSFCNVTYQTNLTFSKDNNQQLQVVFQGIDTYSVIKLNGKQLLKTKNAFVEYRIKLNRNDIKYGQNNLLQVELFSTRQYQTQQNVKNRMPFIYAHSRKAAYQYSWDWAPNLNTMGIWKKVYILAYAQTSIDYVWIRNRQITQQSAILNFAVALNQDPQKTAYNVQIYHNNTLLIAQEVNSRYTYADVQIQRPRFWWPNGIGVPNIYDFQVRLVQKQGAVYIDKKDIPFGIRTVQLNQQKNQFTVIVNGYPIYCKGANYVPPDMFYPRQNNPDYKPGYTYKQLINDAVQSHFNMIRLWGGGQYQSNQFLQLASRKGIMIFYDFMFSDSIYPSKLYFLANVETQIVQQVRRARNYPCLVLWSGNNQIYQGILSWGWNTQKYREDFKRLFESTIPAILKKQNPQTPYISSSPVNGIGNGGFERGGDIHYWGVWAGGALFQSYKTAIGPFNSQFGTQGVPVWQTVISFTDQNNRGYQAEQFSSHQKHNSRFGTLNRYISTYGHVSRNFELQVYLSGLIQAYGVEIAIKYQRISKPKSYGTLYWQFNDAWPAISWSSIDYYGRWKPLQYMARRLYPDVAIFCADGQIVTVNDNLHPVNALAIVKVQHFNGSVLYMNTSEVVLAENQVRQIEQIKKNDFQSILKEIVVYTEIISGREKQMSSTYFFASFKQLLVDPTAKLFVKVIQQHNVLVLRTNKFIKNLYISSSKQYIKLNDNYFDMIADKSYKVILNKTHKLKDIRQSLVFRSYVQIHSDINIQVTYQ